jgi:hypothetical protein
VQLIILRTTQLIDPISFIHTTPNFEKPVVRNADNFPLLYPRELGRIICNGWDVTSGIVAACRCGSNVNLQEHQARSSYGRDRHEKTFLTE